MDEQPTDQQPTMSYKELRSIIRRAAEYDALDEHTISEADLQEIAEELGISAESVARALANHRKSKRQQLLRPRFKTLAVSAGALISGMALGAGALAYSWLINELSLSHHLGLLVFAAPLLFAATARGERKQFTFHLRNAGYWAGIVGSISIVFGSLPSLGDVAETAAIAATGSVVGGLVLWLRTKISRRRSPPDVPHLRQPTAATDSGHPEPGDFQFYRVADPWQCSVGRTALRVFGRGFMEASRRVKAPRYATSKFNSG